MGNTFTKLILSVVVTVCLSACDSDDDLVEALTTQLGAATEHPCLDQFDYQQALNGIPDDIRRSSESVDGATIITEQHWYASQEMIVFYNYPEAGGWCNDWNQNGVVWE